jgi:hypothetical protein
MTDKAEVGNRPTAAAHVIYFEDMSNQTLIDRMEVALGCVRDGNMNGSQFAQVMRLNGSALEAMPYALIQDMRSIIGELDIAQWYDEDGFLPELNIVLIKAESWLAKIPRKA